jgi:16S rRNA (uracil1498-N3)-methyltransferase
MSAPIVTDFSTPRLYVDEPLAAGVVIAASDNHSHYLIDVMRRAAGDVVLLFNGRDGEWAATISVPKKKQVSFTLVQQQRKQDPLPDVTLLFAPLKAGPIEFLVEKATELGVGTLMPVSTRRTVVHRVNLKRLTAIAVEAAEQCERLTVPHIHELRSLETALDDLATATLQPRLLFLDEGAARDTAAKPIADVARDIGAPIAFLIGPEGGFDAAEQRALRSLPFAVPTILGPRILRAETAGLAALACWQALSGDWRG